MTGQQTAARAGGCLCGAVRYQVRGPLRGIALCHCGQCRRWHGYLGAYSSAARADVLVEDGAALVWFASSARGRRGFCRACGSSLFFETVGGNRLAIAAGSLDQPSGLEVIGHEYVADQADYMRLDDGLPARAGDWARREPLTGAGLRASLGAIICPEASAQDGPRASLTSRSWAWAIELLPGAGARPPAARSGLESGAILTI